MRTWLSLLLIVLLSAPAAAAHHKKKKKKADEYENSKYKSYKVLTDDNRTYRFDSRGNPIAPAKKKPEAAPPAEAPAGAAPACAPGAVCQNGSPKT